MHPAVTVGRHTYRWCWFPCLSLTALYSALTLSFCLLQAFVLMVSLSFEDVSHKEQFLTFWRPLADHVKAHEPGTLAFELLQPDTEPTELLVYERCADHAGHFGTAQHSRQHSCMQAYGTEMHGCRFLQLFVSRLLRNCTAVATHSTAASLTSLQQLQVVLQTAAVVQPRQC